MSSAVSDHAISRQAKSPQHGDALQRLFQRVGQMSSIPSAAQRVLQVAENQESCAADLLMVVEQDPTLAFRVLRTVNSSCFGLSNDVSDLKTAIAMLGFVEVRNLALTVYVARLCEEAFEYRGFSREKLWQHMVTVGSIARAMASPSSTVVLRKCFFEKYFDLKSYALTGVSFLALRKMVPLRSRRRQIALSWKDLRLTRHFDCR